MSFMITQGTNQVPKLGDISDGHLFLLWRHIHWIEYNILANDQELPSNARLHMLI